MSHWRTIFKEFGAELRKRPVFYGFSAGCLVSASWASKIFWAHERSDRNMARLAWELSRVQEVLDHLEELGGLERALEHSVWHEYCHRKNQISKSLRDYDQWNKKSPLAQFFSIPPHRRLNHY